MYIFYSIFALFMSGLIYRVPQKSADMKLGAVIIPVLDPDIASRKQSKTVKSSVLSFFELTKFESRYLFEFSECLRKLSFHYDPLQLTVEN